MISWTVEHDGNGTPVAFKLVVECRRYLGTWKDNTLSFDDVLWMVECMKDKLLAALKPEEEEAA